MSASLVGSEMCIRDSCNRAQNAGSTSASAPAQGCVHGQQSAAALGPSVSYTHLTLPTICSV
eukprot:5505993-Alexandrium_andersonii.AAC.1